MFRRLADDFNRLAVAIGRRRLLGGVIALTLSLVLILVQINDWNRAFYEALQNYDFAAFGPLFEFFIQLAFAVQHPELSAKPFHRAS